MKNLKLGTLVLGVSALLAAWQARPGSAQEKARARGDLGAAATKTLAAKYKDAEHWALILVALGKRWHPAGAEMILGALRGKDVRLRAYAVEALRRSGAESLQSAATREVVDALVRKELKDKNPFYRGRVMEVLKRIAPDAGADEAAGWGQWWDKARDTYAPPPWQEPVQRAAPEGQGAGQTVAEELIDRAFDINEVGLEVAIVMDSTGSMQWTIDAARDGVIEIVAMLKGIAPKFRLGLVHYRDDCDMKDPAQVLVPLTENVEAVRAALAKLAAMGGGDLPERVDRWLELALNPMSMGWGKGTNKVVILMGDAPPHEKDMARTLALARNAFEKPFGTASGGRKKSAIRPIVTSAIGVGMVIVKETETAFKDIAKAGGGAYGVLRTKMKGVDLPADVLGHLGGDDGSGDIVKRIMILSFGGEWEREMAAFVATYQEYRRGAFFQ